MPASCEYADNAMCSFHWWLPIFISKLINVNHPCLHLQKLLLGLGTCAIRTQSSAPLVPANNPSDYRIFSYLIIIIIAITIIIIRTNHLLPWCRLTNPPTTALSNSIMNLLSSPMPLHCLVDRKSDLSLIAIFRKDLHKLKFSWYNKNLSDPFLVRSAAVRGVEGANVPKHGFKFL